ncbi:Uncharacterized protein PCOAH_00031250 [Plasmodium coatneyi]|uniref:MMS19 nucleotide excision repair protein n=1 Tax=Plasmodium coatneyi TaxID=208452 RepID=A0A1B1E0N2_9APIC|nr:Uncharacterized protein PCOAH_00031250 [Plasmodium coatneyi]ANQ08593.1 Uncharacterized protein PCOAH_00031250 [Plasmodium coatneyi]
MEGQLKVESLVETLVDEYISPEKVMFRYDREKKVELMYERKKDKEVNKIRADIVKKLIQLVQINHTEGKNRHGTMVQIIGALKRFLFCNENMKRGSAVNLIAQLFEEISIVDLDTEYLECLVFFYIKLIEDWHCVNGVTKFLLIMFERYRDLLRGMKFSCDVKRTYRILFASTRGKGKKHPGGVDLSGQVDRGDRDDWSQYEEYATFKENGGVYYSDASAEEEDDEDGYEERGDFQQDKEDVDEEDDAESEEEMEKEKNTCVVYKIMKSLFKHVHAPSYLQNIRLNCYRIILISLHEFRAEMVAIPNFIDKIQVQLENESDPRNILVLFDIIQVLCSGYITHEQGGEVHSDGTAEGAKCVIPNGLEEEATQERNPGALFTVDRERHYLKSVIDIAFYYFPIEFVNSEARYDSITEEDLQKAFYKCLKSNSRLGNHVIMSILEELYNTQEDEINEKNLQNIKDTLEVCAPFYGSVCCSEFVSTITGLIELECIDSDASDKMATYFVKILLLFFNIINEEEDEQLKQSLFDMHFAGMFRKLNNFLILHKCLCNGKAPLENVAPEGVDPTVDPPVRASSTERNSLAELFRLEEIANLSDSSKSGSDRSDRSNRSNRSNLSRGSGGSAPQDHSDRTSESDRNILSIIREKNHIEKMKEKKEKQKKRNKIKLNKFPIIEKILVCISKGNTYVFLYVLETTLKPMLHECYYLVHALTGEGKTPTRVNTQELSSEKDSLTEHNAKIKAKWNLVATYLSFINNVMSKSAKVEEIVAKKTSFVKEICIIGELLRMGKDQFFHEYHESGLHLFGILASFVCMHGGAAVGENATGNVMENVTNDDTLFHQTIILFFYLIGMHPGENVKLHVLDDSGRDLLDQEGNHFLKNAEEWRRSIVENHHEFIADMKQNNENILRECKEYKKNDLLFFLTLVGKIIRHKYEQISSYVNTLLINLCFLLVKFHFGKKKDLELCISLLRDTYQVDIPYLLFISTNVASFVLKNFYHHVEEVKEEFLLLKGEEGTTGSASIQLDNQTDCQLDLELSPQMDECEPHSGISPDGVIAEIVRFGGDPIGETLKWKRVQVKCLLVGSKQGVSLKKSYEMEGEKKKKKKFFWGKAKKEEKDTTWESQSFKVPMCESTNWEDITSFYLSYIVSLAYWQIYKACEGVIKGSATLAVSDESPNDQNDQDKDKVKDELCKTYLLVNNVEVMELCVNYLYEEAVVRSILPKGTPTKEEKQKGQNKADNLKCIQIMNSNEELSYYGTYVNNLKSFIRINEVTNLHLRGQINKRGKPGTVLHSQISPIRYLPSSNPFLHVDVFETDTLLYILKMTLTSHIICEDWKGKADQKGDVEMPTLASYLYEKVKKNVNHIFITMSEEKKKEFIERLIDCCVGGDAHTYMSDKEGMFGGSIEGNYHLVKLNREKFSPRLMNPLLLLFLPALLSIYTQIGLEHMQKLLKLCMHIFLFNLPLESCPSDLITTYEDNSNGGGTNRSAFPTQESVLKFLDQKCKEHLNEGKVPFWDGDHVGDCLLHLDRANLESVHKCALQIVGILMHNWDGIHKMVNFILAPFDLVEEVGISINGALSFKHFIDLFAATYEAFIRRWEKADNGAAATSMGEEPPRVGESSMVPLLSTLFEAPTWDPSNQLFYLLDCIYFEEGDTEFSQIFYSRGKNAHHLGEKATANGIGIRLLDRRYWKGDNCEGCSPRELKFMTFFHHEEGTIRVANLKGVMRLSGGQSNGDIEQIEDKSSGRVIDEGTFFLRRHFLHFFVQHFSLNYDLTVHLWKHIAEEVTEENLNLLCDSVASASLHEDTFKHVLIWHFYLYPSHVYSHIYAAIHNINTKLLLREENYNRVAFKPSDAFLTLCREPLLHFICTMYNYMYLVDVSGRFLSVSEFLWFMQREKFSFECSLPFDVIRRNEKTLAFLEKLSSYLHSRGESSDRGTSKEVTSPRERMNQVKREDSISDEHLYDSPAQGMINPMDASNKQVEEHSDIHPCKENESDGHTPKGSNFLSLLQKRKENRTLKYNCRYLCLVHLASIVLLHTPVEEALQEHYNVMEICILKGIGKISNFFISKGEYNRSNKRYINGVLRKNAELVRVLFAEGADGPGEEGKHHEHTGEQLIGREVVSLLIVLTLRLLYLIMNLFNFVVAHEGQIWGSRDGPSPIRASTQEHRKGTLEENVQFLLSYKCRLVKSLLKLIVSIPLPLARYQCACIFYILSFLNYKSFLPYDVIQDIKWYLSIASVDPHKKVRKMVVLCRARWM